MKYNVKFNFNLIVIKNKISGNNGEIEITTDLNQEELKNSQELKKLISNDIEGKTKKKVISLDIIDVQECIS